MSHVALFYCVQTTIRYRQISFLIFHKLKQNYPLQKRFKKHQSTPIIPCKNYFLQNLNCLPQKKA